ncbi:MAG: hypothetical protein EZS28_019898 [Streblomastix strix]|uniref:Uncharacterized protein n=1 Tax=Streblomastix strix TaxID=222440 RepID=A0A5J4VQP5_9EUKA|nr:MAG: hypothetical protein EZS28_019898 [Streblomastix strix]
MKIGIDATQDHSKNAHQFNGLGTLQTQAQGTNSSHTVDLIVMQLYLVVFQSDRQLAPTIATNALIQCTILLPLVYGQLVQILEGITVALLQETDFQAKIMSYTQVLEEMQRAARAPQLLQYTEIPAADRQLLPPLQTLEVLASGFQLQDLEFWELGRMRKYGENKTFSGINAYLFDRNNDSLMSHANLATTQRQIGIKLLASGQSVANAQGNLIGANAFLNLQPLQSRAMLTPAQITNIFLLGINTKQEQQTQQSQISQAPSLKPFQAKFQQNLQLQQQSQSLNRGLLNTDTQPQLNQQNYVFPDLSVNRQQQITPNISIVQNPQQQGADSEGNQTQFQNTVASNSHTVIKIDMESEGRYINPPPLEAKINQASFNRQRDYWATKLYLIKYVSKPGAGQHHPGLEKDKLKHRKQYQVTPEGKLSQMQIGESFGKSWIQILNQILQENNLLFQTQKSKAKRKIKIFAFWNNTRKRCRQDDRSSSGGNNQNFQPRYNNRKDFRSQRRRQRRGREDYRRRGQRGNRGGHNRDNRSVDTYYNGSIHNMVSVAPWPPVESVPITSSNIVFTDLNQRQICGPTPQLPSIATSQSSETSSSNIVSIPTPSVHQVQQEQYHLLLPLAAVSPPPIFPSNIKLPPVVDIQPNNINQPVNYKLEPQQQAKKPITINFQILLTSGRVQLPIHKVENLEHNKELRDFTIRGYFRRIGLEMNIEFICN